MINLSDSRFENDFVTTLKGEGKITAIAEGATPQKVWILLFHQKSARQLV